MFYGRGTLQFTDRKRAITRSFYHEIGHAIDCINGWPSTGEDFLKAYESEKEEFNDIHSIGNGHETSNNYEYFAAVFSNILKGNNSCQKDIPQSYEIVYKYVK